jgi:hypothetical protein
MLGQARIYVLRGCTWKQPCKHREIKEFILSSSTENSASKHASTQARTHARKQASKQASKQEKGIKGTCETDLGITSTK